MAGQVKRSMLHPGFSRLSGMPRVQMDPKRPSYVALFDVLGFRKYVETNPIEEAGALLAELKIAVNHLGLDSIQFSDSILIYTKGTEFGKLTTLVKAAIRLIGHSANAQICLRAAITSGEFWDSGGVFVGKAMIRAYDLERDQDWVGGILDPLLGESDPGVAEEIEQMRKGGLILEYRAPIKGGHAGVLNCLAWPRNYRSKVSPMATLPASSWDVMRKDSNTQDFLDRWHKTRFESWEPI